MSKRNYTPVQCPHCDKCYPNKGLFNKHLNKVHSDKLEIKPQQIIKDEHLNKVHSDKLEIKPQQIIKDEHLNKVHSYKSEIQPQQIIKDEHLNKVHSDKSEIKPQQIIKDKPNVCVSLSYGGVNITNLDQRVSKLESQLKDLLDK